MINMQYTAAAMFIAVCLIAGVLVVLSRFLLEDDDED